MSGPDDVSTIPGAAYPADWEADVVLRDGATAHLRPIAPTGPCSVRAELVQEFDVRQHRIVESSHLRIGALDHVVLIRRVRA